MKTILIVDDDAVVLAVYQKRLEREGFRVEVARDGLAAMKMLSELKPDLVVLDLMMPKINGVDVLKFIRADARLKTTPVIIFSNAYVSELAQQAMAAGADKGLLKASCTPALLLQCARDLLAGTPGVGDTSQLLAVRAEAAAPAAAPPPAEGGAETVALAAGAAVGDRAALKNVRAEFLKDASVELVRIRDHCSAYIEACSSTAGLVRLNNLYQRLHFAGARAGLAGCGRIALLATAFEALLFELIVKPSLATPSTLHTIARAMDCLSLLFEKAGSGFAEVTLKAKVLVVDDDAVSNRLMVAALKRANLAAESTAAPQTALQMLQAGHYDLILLDIFMPGMNGFAVCAQLRRFPGYLETPVIFVTAHDDFENRIQSILSGGNDLIAKPVFPLELALKATTDLLQAQLQGDGAAHSG